MREWVKNAWTSRQMREAWQVWHTILKSFIILYNSAMSFTRFALGEKPSFLFVFKHCYIEGTMSGYDKQLILIIFWTFQGPRVLNKLSL